MEPISTFFKIENDILYRLGEIRGRENARKEAFEKYNASVVKKLLLSNKCTVADIAGWVNVSEDFVLKIQNSL